MHPIAYLFKACIVQFFKFPCGHGYGLVCFLKDHCRIGEVTSDSIEIIHQYKKGKADVLMFRNPDVSHTTVPEHGVVI